MKRGALRWLAGAALAVAALCVALDVLFPFPYEELSRPPAVVVLDRSGDPLRLFLAVDGRWRLPVALDDLPPRLVDAVLASEDRWFYSHPGVNPFAVVRAAWQNLRAGQVVSGASTVSMQVARMIRPAPRTLGSKLRETFRALQLEAHRDKRQILESYLNLLPYGGNVEGIAAAARFYFGKTPEQLSAGEIGLLVLLPRSPRLYDPTLHPRQARRGRDRLLTLMARRGILTPEEARAAGREPLPSERLPVPFEAPHLARLATRLFPGRPSLTTTVDRSVQSVAAAQVERHVRELRRSGIGNAAVVVLENDSRAVRALVGSADFFDAEHDGQVDGALARRSPGSTLKPFLYALALERGEILVDSYLLDIPTDFAGYTAENYDGRYRGRVTARTALSQSLNAPAVRLLARIGLERFHRLLVRGGLASIDRPATSYGLPLVLGAAEVNLLELTTLYAALARGGSWRPPRILEEQPAGSPERLFSRETAWQVTEVLTEVRRPDLPASWDLTRGAPTVAWKTGTSYGHRDAWAVGYSSRYTVGVWVGNFDGSACQGISGSEHAAPLLFDLLRALEPGGVAPTRPPGLRLETIEVCATSHQLPGPYCPLRQKVAYARGRTHLEGCAYHRRHRADATPAGESRWVVDTVYPAELVSWWRHEGQPLPEGAPAVADTARQPRIVSPDPATRYRLRRDAPRQFQKLELVARTELGTQRLFWFQDGRLLATVAPEERLFVPLDSGSHRLVVSDENGRSDSVTYVVD